MNAKLDKIVRVLLITSLNDLLTLALRTHSSPHFIYMSTLGR